MKVLASLGRLLGCWAIMGCLLGDTNIDFYGLAPTLMVLQLQLMLLLRLLLLWPLSSCLKMTFNRDLTLRLCWEHPC